MPPISQLDHLVAVQPFHIDPGGPVESGILHEANTLPASLQNNVLNEVGLRGANPQTGRASETPGSLVSLNPQPLPPVASQVLNLWETSAVLRSGANLPGLF